MTETYGGPDRRRRPEPEETFAQLPIWAKVIGLIGIPGAIALFLVWIGANDLPRMARQIDQIHQEVLYNRKLIEEGAAKSDATFRLLQRICSNTAKSDIERSRCFD